jgi:hypothetical protein
MKVLEIPSGGMPFTGDDLLWIQDGIKEAVEASVTPFTIEGKIILTGCTTSVVSGSTVIAPGYVVLDGRICHFPGKTVAGTNLAIHEFYMKEEYDPAGNDVFADSVSRDTYKKVSVDVRSFTAVEPTTLRLSEIEAYRIKLPKTETFTYTRDGGATTLRFTRYGPFVNINGNLADSFPRNSTQNMNLPANFLTGLTRFPVYYSDTVMGHCFIAVGLITLVTTGTITTGYGIVNQTIFAAF